MSAREVELTGGAPWGFRMHGGVDQNQPLRISRVNPGRKASLSGIREGDIITSINGKATKDMSNADAHAMLRSAGPALRLGLNEDREMSPRRRSIGKAAELKRPSQLISEINSGRATPQAPVYATIRPPQSPQNKLLQSPIRSLNSPQSILNSTPLVKSIASSEEPLKFHPTNPFYSTLPSNYNSSKLPLPNGKVSNAPMNRSVNKSDSYSDKNHDHDLKLSSFFLRKFDSGPSSIPNMNYDAQPKSLYEHTPQKSLANDKYNTVSSSQMKSGSLSRKQNTASNEHNPFESSTTNDFHQYDQSDNKVNGSSSKGANTIFYSKSDGDFQLNDEVVKHSTITEKTINEVEEIKTIKTITLNGCNENDNHHRNGIFNSSEELSKYDTKRSSSQDHFMKEHLIPTTIENEEIHKNGTDLGGSRKQDFLRSPSCQSTRREYNVGEVRRSESVDVVVSRPPVKSPSSSVTTSQVNKRGYTT